MVELYILIVHIPTPKGCNDFWLVIYEKNDPEGMVLAHHLRVKQSRVKRDYILCGFKI